MRHGTSNGRRQRGRGNGGGNGGRRNNQRMQVFDSNGPDVRIRGTAHQVTEKYMALAKDSTAAGDHIMAQSYLQHAEHYQRIINSWGEDIQEQQGRKNSNENSSEKIVEKTKAPDDDLSLPSSILGGDSKVESQDISEARTAETAE